MRGRNREQRGRGKVKGGEGQRGRKTGRQAERTEGGQREEGNGWGAGDGQVVDREQKMAARVEKQYITPTTSQGPCKEAVGVRRSYWLV